MSDPKKPGESDLTLTPEKPVETGGETRHQGVEKLVIGKRPDIKEKLETSLPPRFKNEVMHGNEITPETVTEISNFYRELFANTMHYAVCPPCESKGLPARWNAMEALRSGGQLVPLQEMDERADEVNCPHCNGPTIMVYDPETLRENFRQKLEDSNDSVLSILRRTDGSVAGLAFAYQTYLDRELELEWGSHYPFIKPEHQKPEYRRSREKYLETAAQATGGGPYDGSEAVWAWNCISTAPDAKGSLPVLLQNMFKAIPDETQDLPILGDVKKGSKAHQIFRMAGGQDGTEFFDEHEGDILIGGKTRTAVESFTLPPEEFRARRKKEKK